MLTLDNLSEFSGYGSYESRTQETLQAAKALHATATHAIREIGAAKGLEEYAKEMDQKRREQALIDKIADLEKESLKAFTERKVIVEKVGIAVPAVVVKDDIPVIAKPPVEKAEILPQIRGYATPIALVVTGIALLFIFAR